MPLLFIEPTTENILPYVIMLLCGMLASAVACIVFMAKHKGKGTNGHPLSATQELQIRRIVEEMVVRRGLPGGLHDLKNKVVELSWKVKELGAQD